MMSRPTYLKQIKKIVVASATNTIFVPADFYHITTPAKVGMCVKRLCESGELNRLMRRLYIKPGNSYLNPDSVARAIARSYGGEAVPCGETALYRAGIINKAPSVWTYASDGQYSSCVYDGNIIEFKRTAKKG